MASQAQDHSQIVSVRLPDELIRRLDRYLDWSATSGRVKVSRNAALREALRTWLDDQEQLAGFVSPETLRGQFRTAYDQVSQGRAWVLIPRLRQQLQWPQERCDTVLEGLRADGHVELARAKPDETHATDTQESYTVHGHLYVRLRWRDG
jgi:predicted transcriptional regulator